MKIKRHIKLFLSFTIAIMSCSCGFIGEQQYIRNADEVELIQIVCLNGINEENNYTYEYTILATIDDCEYELFMEKLSSIKHRVHWGEPILLKMDTPVIRIEFQNGNLDIMDYNAQCFRRNEFNGHGYFVFNEDEFSRLLEMYLE